MQKQGTALPDSGSVRSCVRLAIAFVPSQQHENDRPQGGDPNKPAQGSHGGQESRRDDPAREVGVTSRRHEKLILFRFQVSSAKVKRAGAKCQRDRSNTRQNRRNFSQPGVF
jgi:hypothetical protein